ncbi:hypothetical protein FHX75_15202 [Micromonospora palomenae]|uniref:DUF4352 domain-containing protein n=1 Tax=Micromonospora palomenae TaxID=1461247 RepID=A0A561VHM7_9ACTN|nr:hypothetical protein [Micromonospora palomenae]TWG11113.1 hypothetical protein FHX75_15202 [Micromonospora palomenae]
MPASRRHHRALAVFVNGLGILAAVPALPTATHTTRAEAAPAVTTPASPPATATPTGPAAAPLPTGPATPMATPQPAGHASPAAPGAAATGNVIPVPPGMPAPGMATTANPGSPRPAQPVTVTVAPAGTPVPGYRIQLRNDSGFPLDTTVRQELPAGASPTAVSAGGRAVRSAGNGTAEVTWRLRLPARSTTTLDTALAATPPGTSVTAPACAFTSDGNRPYDCATATWQAAAAPATRVEEAAPAWRRPPILAAALAALLVIAGAGLWWGQRTRRRRSGVEPTGTAPTVVGNPTYAGGAAAPGGGTVYPRPAAPGGSGRRRTPPVWMIVGVAAAILAGVVFAAGWTATQRVAAIDTTKQPTSGAWMGRGATGSVGVPLRENAFEFTVYRVACETAGGTGRRCHATVGVRNLTPEQQAWHGELQRAYLPGGNWVSTDEPATRLANLGRDVFAQPVAAGNRVVLPLVFTLNGPQKPKQLELRSGVFSAGVRVDVP